MQCQWSQGRALPANPARVPAIPAAHDPASVPVAVERPYAAQS